MSALPIADEVLAAAETAGRRVQGRLWEYDEAAHEVFSLADPGGNYCHASLVDEEDGRYIVAAANNAPALARTCIELAVALERIEEIEQTTDSGDGIDVMEVRLAQVGRAARAALASATQTLNPQLEGENQQ